MTRRGESLNAEANIRQIIDFNKVEKPSVEDDIRRDRLRLKILHSNRRINSSSESKSEAEIDKKVLGHYSDIWNRRYTDPVDHNAPVRPKPPVSHVNPFLVHSHKVPPPGYPYDNGLWETSSRQPGQPGFGYKQDGTPVGSEYITCMRDQKVTFNPVSGQSFLPSSRPQDAVDERLKEARQDGSDRTLQHSGEVIKRRRSHRRKTDMDAKRQNQRRQDEELNNFANLINESDIE